MTEHSILSTEITADWSEDVVNQADYQMRHWQWQDSCPIQYGSNTHLQMFCQMFLDTHNPYKPAVIEWPKLQGDALARITGLPIWDIAVQTEGHAGLRVRGYAETQDNPLLQQVIMLNGDEEIRHKQVLHNMVAAYGIQLEAEPVYQLPGDREWGFMITGFSECIDSFFAFGLFDLARDSGFFPEKLVQTFEPVMQEECRHILLFANWLSYKRRNTPWRQKPALWLKIGKILLTITRNRIETARAVDTDVDKQNFTATSQKSLGIQTSVAELVARCLSENDRRFAGYDARLLRPQLAPRLARMALPLLKLFKV